MRFAVVFFACAVLGAQDQVPPTIRVNTRLVQISVVVHDKNGQPVADLKREDFTIFERGHEQKIALFDIDSEQSAAQNRAGVSPLPPNTYSNRGFSAKGSVSVVLFDAVNTRFADQVYARDQVLRFIRQIQPGDRVAIYVLGDNSVRVLHDFTDDPERLSKAIEAYRKPSTSLDADQPGGGGSTRLFDDMFLKGDAASQRVSAIIRKNWTLKAMEGIAHHLAGLNGRKNLIWVSAAFPLSMELNPQDNDYEDVLRATRTITDANVAVYPVDARGLMVDPAFAAANTIPIYTGAKTAQLSQIYRPPGHDTMDMLAERTGGRTFINRNDIDSAIQIAVDDARVTYMLGFYLPEKDWDGKFHDIKLKVNRAGVELRYRTGFWAVADAIPNSKDLKAEVSWQLASTLEATAIGLSARVDPREPLAPPKLNLKLEIAAGDVSFTPQNGRWTGSLEIDFAQFAPDGSTLAQTQQPLALDLAQSDYEEFRNHGLILTRMVNLEMRAEVLKVIVVDHATGRMGSLRIPVGSGK